ncbi:MULTISPECIES: ATP-binding protein [unclassified Caballeronia]|uniref:ATP-binding protein n=1 Tax=unclassified Caballeronia TaxID=2646786 RepID=UPI00285F6BCC|nr:MULTISPECIES: cache domain-containing protein [unclassified Caballeronia]MDR5755010.1 cache domain-containing protein [Caballeronia sp. LZ024]MDR5845572.1 cache domain-containing protein [Caballeronia sp. LZ031]
MLRTLLCVAILLPSLFAITYGYFDYQRRVNEANDIADRRTLVVSEQADKVFDLDAQIGARVTELLGTSDDGAITANEQHIHARLAALATSLPQIASLSIFGAQGKVLATSRTWPVPDLSVGEREDFRAARARSPKTYFSSPMLSKIGNVEVFNTAFARLDSNGRFIGVVSIALRRQYFSEFYSRLTKSRPDFGVGLYKSDGSLLVGPLPLDTPAQGLVAKDSGRPFINGQASGHTVMGFAPNDIKRVVSFRQVDDYPVYASSSYSTRAIWQQWLSSYLVIVGAIALPALGVCCLVAFSLRQLAAEQAAWERWHGEVAIRISAEASSHRLRRTSALTNLIGDIAHNVNNLLMVVASNMQVARHKRFVGLESEVIQVEGAIATAEGLMRRLLTVARKRPMRRAIQNVHEMLNESAESIKAATGEGVEYVFEASGKLWPVFVDKQEFNSAIVAIAENAREALPSEGRFVVRCQNIRLQSSEDSLPDGDYVMVSCVDNGVGMSAQSVLHAFEPLFTTKTSAVGAGLGLAQVLAMCEQAGGTARIDSIEGKGTNVRLYLPRYSAQSARRRNVPKKTAEALLAGVPFF